ncbi:hypothetical protein BB561_004447 [Smittium simulii]|uniref:DDE Tnp4 domain-containing protein n=1 Tax=Smittium simulii TaxID=133385 RepID=A0A2T9YG61_9FUNG|nr:hypothetical protein BB561_004447 [Smittium simulii]
MDRINFTNIPNTNSENADIDTVKKKRKNSGDVQDLQLKNKKWKHWIPKNISFIENTALLKPPENFQKTIWELSDPNFYGKMRIQKSTFLFVENLIQKDPVFLNDSKNSQIDVRFQLFIALYRLGCSSKKTSISMIANEAGIANGTVSLYTERVLTALNNVAQSYICWPNTLEKKKISSIFEYNHKMKNCIGILTTTQTILSQRPAISTTKYKTSNGSYGVKSLVVCDNEKYIRFLSNLYPGSEMSETMWENSLILNNPDRYFTDDLHIVSTFQINPNKNAVYLQKIDPYSNESYKLTPREIEERDAQVDYISNIVSETLLLWKNRWSSLYKIKKQLKKPEDFQKIESWIMATAVLHNIACEHEGNWMGE